MFKRFALLMSLIFTLSMASNAGAQSVPTLDPNDVPGLESGYARMYIADIKALMATPGAIEAMATPGALGDLALSGMAAVFTFEDEDTAEDAFGTFGQQFAQGFMEGSGTEAEPTEIDDLGNQAVEYVGETEVDDQTTSPISIILVQDGEHIFIAMILGGSDVSASTRGLAEYLIDADIPDSEVMFNEDGTSTGGVFDILPSEESPEIVGGMVPFMDIDFMADAAQ